jgi:hypothetical protein
MESHQTSIEEHVLSALQARLDRLEAKNRLLSWALLALLAIGGLLAILSAVDTPQDVIHAKGFDVVDDSGNVLAAFGILETGTPVLRLNDAEGNVRSQLGISEDGMVFIDFTGADGSTRLALSTHADGTPEIDFFGPNGKARAAMGTLADGTPGLAFFDAEGNSTFSAP